MKPESNNPQVVANNCLKRFVNFLLSFSFFAVLSVDQNLNHLLEKSTSQLVRKTNKHPSSPVKSFFEALSLDVKLEDGPLAIGGGVVAPTVLLKESIKAVF